MALSLTFNIAIASSLSTHAGNVGTLTESHNFPVSSEWIANLDLLVGHTLGNPNWLGYGKIGAAFTYLQWFLAGSWYTLSVCKALRCRPEIKVTTPIIRRRQNNKTAIQCGQQSSHIWR